MPKASQPKVETKAKPNRVMTVGRYVPSPPLRSSVRHEADDLKAAKQERKKVRDT